MFVGLLFMSAIAVGLLLLLIPPRKGASPLPPERRRHAQAAGVWRLAGLIAGLVAAGLIADSGADILGQLLALALTMGFVAAELFAKEHRAHGSYCQETQPQTVQRVRRWRRGGMLAGFAAAVALFSTQSFNSGSGKVTFFTAAPLLGACVVGAILVSEALIASPQGNLRSAKLRRRRIRDYIPRRQTQALVLLTTASLLLMVGTTIMYLGGAPRIPSGELNETWTPSPPTYAFRCPSGEVEEADFWGIANIPWILAGCAAGLALTLLALRRIVTRPPLDPDPALQEADESQRNSSARAVVQAYGVLLASSFSACAYFMSNAFSFTCQSLRTLILGNIMQALAYVSAAALIYFLIALTRASRSQGAE
ncbi:hypothetical protein ACF064_34595 [Streptomyces sp. NPDC015492]|uniref:hypothetical protein n=1 Tax=Streptomyces sp. NPDC015492 TaxID=3364958 RepID=UPI0036FCDF78